MLTLFYFPKISERLWGNLFEKDLSKVNVALTLGKVFSAICLEKVKHETSEKEREKTTNYEL